MMMIKFTMCLLIIHFSFCHGKSPNKIINGVTILNTVSVPFMVSIKYQGTHVCSGGIITKRHILTSASCVTVETNIFPANLQCVTNTTGFSDQDALVYNVDRIINYPTYEPRDSWIHDLAVLSLESLMTFSESCTRIFLPKERLYFASSLLVFGWGERGHLSMLRMKIGSFVHCEEIYPGFTFNNDEQSCVYTIKKDAEISWGDGGNPLVNHDTLSAIISVFNPEKSNYAIITKTWRYVSWITKMVHTV